MTRLNKRLRAAEESCGEHFVHNMGLAGAMLSGTFACAVHTASRFALNNRQQHHKTTALPTGYSQRETNTVLARNSAS